MLVKQYLGDKIRKDEMGRTCSTHRNASSRYLNESEHFERLHSDLIVILIYVVKETGWVVVGLINLLQDDR
jgi:hypothetical protein